LGVGNGQFSNAVSELERQNIVPLGISRHTTPQGEFFYAGAERGWPGILAVVALFLSWIWGLRLHSRSSVIAAVLGALIATCFIDSMYLEITRFRFLWFYAAFFLVYAYYTNSTTPKVSGR